AAFDFPYGLTVTAGGDVLVAEAGSVIRRISGDDVTTVAGAPSRPGSDDGVGAAARFDGPQGLAVGADGTVYVADENDCGIRAITPGGVVTTLAGGGCDHADGTGDNARF